MGGAYVTKQSRRQVELTELDWITVEPIELLDFTNKFIQTRTERHEQGTWMDGEIEGTGTQIADQNICGTTGCVAGWGAIFAGYFQVRPHEDEYGEMAYNRVVDPSDGQIYTMSDAAAREFNLSPIQAMYMFAGTNDRQAIQEMVDALVEDSNASLAEIRRYAERRYFRRLHMDV